ncbi:MAG: XRE family transcriptional regulator [Streptococcaceae bacterium]|jgi:hypothetical protein|nr:XRE family transcriptional regulator [Streptococcaceae bacterium]
MIADTQKIEWLLENRTQYFIAKNTSVPQSTVSDLKTGKKKLNNIILGTAVKLTNLAIQEQQATQD